MFPLSSYHNLVVITFIFVNLSSISVERLMRESARDFSRWNRFDIVNHELSCWVTVVITHTQLSCSCVALARFKLYTPDWRFGSFTRNILDMRNGDRERTKLKPTKKREKKKVRKEGKRRMVESLVRPIGHDRIHWQRLRPVANGDREKKVHHFNMMINTGKRYTQSKWLTSRLSFHILHQHTV